MQLLYKSRFCYEEDESELPRISSITSYGICLPSGGLSFVCHLVKVKKKFQYAYLGPMAHMYVLHISSSPRQVSQETRGVGLGHRQLQRHEGLQQHGLRLREHLQITSEGFNLYTALAYTTLLQLCVLISLRNTWLGVLEDAQVSIYSIGTRQLRLSLFHFS